MLLLPLKAYLLLVLFVSICAVCAVNIYFAENTSNSLTSLLYCVVLASCSLLLFRAEFLSFAYILVYGGAGTVLFLFVILSTDLRKEDTWRNKKIIILNKHLNRFLTEYFEITTFTKCWLLLFSDIKKVLGNFFFNVVFIVVFLLFKKMLFFFVLVLLVSMSTDFFLVFMLEKRKLSYFLILIFFLILVSSFILYLLYFELATIKNIFFICYSTNLLVLYWYWYQEIEKKLLLSFSIPIFGTTITISQQMLTNGLLFGLFLAGNWWGAPSTEPVNVYKDTLFSEITSIQQRVEYLIQPLEWTDSLEISKRRFAALKWQSEMFHNLRAEGINPWHNKDFQFFHQMYNMFNHKNNQAPIWAPRAWVVQMFDGQQEFSDVLERRLLFQKQQILNTHSTGVLAGVRNVTHNELSAILNTPVWYPNKWPAPSPWPTPTGIYNVERWWQPSQKPRWY